MCHLTQSRLFKCKLLDRCWPLQTLKATNTDMIYVYKSPNTLITSTSTPQRTHDTCGRISLDSEFHDPQLSSLVPTSPACSIFNSRGK